MVKLLRRGKIVFTVHGLGTKGLGGHIVDIVNAIGLNRLLVKTVLFQYPYDCLISVDHQTLIEKVAAKRTFVIGNGVDPSVFRKAEKKKKRNSKYFKILWVGRMVEVKGLANLVEAIYSLDCLQIKVTLVGDGPEKRTIRKLINKGSHVTRFRFTGQLFGRRLINEYKSADLFVLPSLASEGFPLTIVEAMAAKLPIVVTNVGDCEMLIHQARCGLVVPPGNIQQLAIAIGKLIKIEESRRIDMGENGYNFAKKHYSWDKVAEKVYQAYQQQAL